MKKINLICSLFFLCFVLSSCFSVPKNSEEYDFVILPARKELIIESLKGTVRVSTYETPKNNSKPLKKKSEIHEKENVITLMEGCNYSYILKGNFNIVLSLATTDEEAVIRVLYKNKTTEYIIHNYDFIEKFIYFENY